MTSRRRTNRLLIFPLVGLALLAMGYQLVQARLSRPEVRNFAEAKASQILKAPVKISRIRYLPPAQLSLEGIQIEPPQIPASSSIAQIEKLVIGYGLINLIRRDFNLPGHILLKRPWVHFSSSPQVPFWSVASTGASPAAISVQEGTFHFPWRGEGAKLVFEKVRLKARLDVRGRIQLEVASTLGGVAQGKIEIKGFTDPQFDRFEFDVGVDDVNFLPGSRIPLRKVEGKFRWTDQLIQTDGATSLFHDWQVQWKGEIKAWRGTPDVSLDLAHKKGKTPFHFSTHLDFPSEKVTGEWSWLGRRYPFQGKIIQEGEKIVFPQLELPHRYAGKGEINRENGDYHFEFERDRRRFRLRSNLTHLEFQTEFQLDHASVNHLDWVALGRVRLSPMPKQGEEASPRFKGWIETDYLIVEYEPLEDFQGSFELDAEGIEVIDFKWGGVFHLGGRVLFKGGHPREDLVLRVEGFPLESIKDFSGRPVPENLRGALEGKLRLQGELSRPEVHGYFTIKDGTIEKLDYDRAIVQFRGFPPYLKLYDSKIFRGRNTLKLLGAIDLNLENIFHGIQIKGPDHLVLWKGMTAFWKEGESAIGAEKPLGKKLAMGLEVGAGRSQSQGEDKEESHAVLGPKVRF